MISGAEEPRAISVRLAIVSFHTLVWKRFFTPLIVMVVSRV